MISRDHVLRLCKAVLFEELQRSFPLGARRNPPELWTELTRIDEEGLGFDSLSLIDLVFAFNRRFSLHLTGVEDYMYVQPELGRWAELLHAHFELLNPMSPVTFDTSGSTGHPRSVQHPLRNLVEEVDGHIEASLALRPQRIISLVPPQHIYGFLFTILLPSRLEVPVVDLLGKGPGALSRTLSDGDLVVGTPHLFGRVLPLCSGAPVAAHAVTSTAPARAVLWDAVRRAGLRGLVEIYGSSETAGVGYRHDGNAPFRLLPYLTPGNPPERDGRGIDLQDYLELDGSFFRVLGRRDSAIQVGGHNVSLQAVADALEANADVREAAVRLDGDRLKAFVVTSPGVDVKTLEIELRTLMATSHSPAARPVRYDFGECLPRNSIGKCIDWVTKREAAIES